MSENVKCSKKRLASSYNSKKAKKLIRDYRVFGAPQRGQTAMQSSSGITAPVYNLTASSLFWK